MYSLSTMELIIMSLGTYQMNRFCLFRLSQYVPIGPGSPFSPRGPASPLGPTGPKQNVYHHCRLYNF